MSAVAPASSTARLTGLPSEIPVHAQVLVVGSMPGALSLATGEYYAHPRNQFWMIVQALYRIERSRPYRQRIEALNARSIGLWDVLQSCDREGSLDASIDVRSAALNDFAPLFAAGTSIRQVLCNGALAGKLFRQRVLPGLAEPPEVLCLPSTSPAHAALSLERKIERWHAALGKSFAAD